MGEPITWRNVQGPSLADAARPMFYAQQSLNSGFDAFGSALKDFQAGEDKIWKEKGIDATQAMLAQLNAARSPEELAALQATGAFDATRADNGARIDRAVINQALDQRPAILQDRLQKEWAFANAQQDQKEAPMVDQAKGLIAQGKVAEATPLIDSLSPRAQAALFVAADEKTQQLLERKWKAEKHPLELDNLRSQINMHNASAAFNNQHGKLLSAQADALNASSSPLTREAQAAMKDNPYAQSGELTANHTPELMKLMKDNGIGHDNAERNAVIERLNKIGSVAITVPDADGKLTVVKVPPSLAAAKAAILSGDDQWFNWYNQGWANDIESKLKNSMQQNTVRMVNGQPVPINQAVEDFRAYQAALLQGVGTGADKKKPKK